MIVLYSGTPGSGKSLDVARNLLNSKHGRYKCITNIITNLDYVDYISNDDLSPTLLINYSKEYFKDKPIKEDKIHLIIDESQLLFNSREWDKNGRKEWISFFTQHRKYGYLIILVAQFDRMLDRQIRSLIEYEYKHRKVSNFGKFGFFLNLFALGGLFVRVKIWYPMNTKVDSEFYRCRKKYYSIYDTFATWELPSVSSGNERAPTIDTLEASKEPKEDSIKWI